MDRLWDEIEREIIKFLTVYGHAVVFEKFTKYTNSIKWNSAATI